MKQLIFPIIFVLATACNHPADDPAQSDLDAVKAQRDAFMQGFSSETVERCDRITFAALAKASGWNGNLALYENPPGKWNRDASPCYPADSKSECSLDGYLSVLHFADAGVAGRMLDYLEPRDWICGEGPESVTSIANLKSVMRKIAGRAGLVDDADATVDFGFRGHLLASYLWLARKVNGQNNAAEKAALWTLYQSLPESPFYAALAEQTEVAVDILMHRFPSPYAQFWGSSVDPVIYAASDAIIEGH